MNSKRFSYWELAALLSAVAAAIAVGYAGLAQYYASRPFTHSDLAYMTLQLFAFQFNPEPAHPCGPLLEFARFTAPLISSYAALRALMALFAEPLRGARLMRLRNHVIVCGLSRKGFSLIKDYHARKQAVVLVEWDKENDLVETCRELGAHIVLGDAAEAVTLRKAGVLKARALFAVCDEDGINAEIGLLARSLSGGRQHSALDTYLHIEDFRLCALLRHHGAQTAHSAHRLHLFNIYENAARHVLRAHPLDGAGIGPSDPRVPHLVVIGFGKLGETLALHAAQLGHFANGHKLRVTLIDRQLPLRTPSFFARYPFFGETCELELRTTDYENLDLLAGIGKLAHDPATVLTVAICLSEDGRSLGCGLRVLAESRGGSMNVLVRLERETGLGLLLRYSKSISGSVIHSFAVGGEFSTEKEIVDKDRNKLARAIHEDYRAQTGTLPEWKNLDEETRDSNRQTADHTPIKMRAIGCRIVKLEKADTKFTFSDEELELLAQMEHQRWCASRQLAGYRFGKTESGLKDAIRRIHPDLVDWAVLPAAEKEKSRRIVSKIPVWLSMIGKGVSRSS